MKDVVKKSIPCKRKTSGAKQRKTPSWMNSNVMSKIKKKNKAYTQFLNSRDGKAVQKSMVQELLSNVTFTV